MITQLQQVARTYATRRGLWMLGVFGLFSFGPSAAILIAGKDAQMPPPSLAAIAIVFPVGITCYVLVTQAKWQYCDSRARLLPGFNPPHLAALALLAVLALGVYPVVLTMSGRWSPLGVSACAV